MLASLLLALGALILAPVAPATAEVTGGGAEASAQDDQAQVWRYGSVVLTVLDNDTAGSGCVLDPGSVSLFGPANPAAGPRGTTDLILPDEGIWSVNSDGSLVFTPNPGFGGWSSWVGYAVQDSCGNAAPARARVYMPAVTATVEPTDDPGTGGGDASDVDDGIGGDDDGIASGDQLAHTGGEDGGLLVIAITLILGGGLLVVLPKHCRRKEDSAAA